MGNTSKIVIHISWSQSWSLFVFLLYKNFTDLQQILETKKNFALAKKKIWKLNINKEESK